MARNHTGAVRSALVVLFWVTAIAPACAVADDAPAASIGASAADEGAALFNPLAGADAPPRPQPVTTQPELPQGDWKLPLLAATAGLIGISVLLRKMID